MKNSFLCIISLFLYFVSNSQHLQLNSENISISILFVEKTDSISAEITIANRSNSLLYLPGQNTLPSQAIHSFNRINDSLHIHLGILDTSASSPLDIFSIQPHTTEIVRTPYIKKGLLRVINYSADYIMSDRLREVSSSLKAEYEAPSLISRSGYVQKAYRIEALQWLGGGGLWGSE